MTKLIEHLFKSIWFLFRILGFIVVISGCYYLFDQLLWASENEDCHKMKSWAEQGHPIVVPDWCDDYLKTTP